MTNKESQFEGSTAGEYAALLNSNNGLIGSELSDLLTEADARAALQMTRSPEESRLEALVAVVREKTREEDLLIFREVLSREMRGVVTVDLPRLTALIGRVVLKIRQLQRSETGRRARSIQLKDDPKQNLKSDIHRFWLEWKDGKHSKVGRRNYQFVMACQKRWTQPGNDKVILGWCTAWNKEAKNKKPSG